MVQYSILVLLTVYIWLLSMSYDADEVDVILLRTGDGLSGPTRRVSTRRSSRGDATNTT